ncbi:MAG: DUF1571 domain-containing protein [Planctomycetales bacterium]|nr:DUF1571 domain-containing protein [Planctomycetales bacterium]NIM08548.1 DUF1571 domain-containing protein [Planctomycetales bacterium]NIN08019.1 DUF1571 domain-containing protein [Planctomycetales bacterium]NIN76545.1 DUF1571 domain-containing protein [Planctomycetales bacterium]NIO33732.1 DUF1571 domain-containing protein [Planctomycetales bacterium]
MGRRLFSRICLTVGLLVLPLGAAANTPFPPGRHPLDPEIERAKQRVATIRREIQDYSCTFTKRERINGKLLDYEQMFLKIRHEPFSVYMYFLAPKEVKGQQVVYIAGRNEGKLIAQPVGVLGVGGPYSLDPLGRFAMKNQRYPITNTGMLRLTEQLIQEAVRDRQFPQITLRYYKGAKVEDRACTVTQVEHPQLPQFQYFRARIFVDDQLNLPIRFESYLWPAKPGGEPLLLEEYTYTRLKLNNGFKDADFQIQK